MSKFKLIKTGKVREIYEIVPGKFNIVDFSYKTNKYIIQDRAVMTHNGCMVMGLLDDSVLNKVIEASRLGPAYLEEAIDRMTGVLR